MIEVEDARFSPVAGIQWVETLACFSFSEKDNGSFSPVAGIQWVETHPCFFGYGD